MNIAPPKYINPDQLHAELGAAGFTHPYYLRSVEVPQDQSPPLYIQFEEVLIDDTLEDTDVATLQTVVDAHVAMRNRTGEEYAAEFQNPATTPARKQEIRDIQNGLLPPETVPMP